MRDYFARAVSAVMLAITGADALALAAGAPADPLGRPSPERVVKLPASRR